MNPRSEVFPVRGVRCSLFVYEWPRFVQHQTLQNPASVSVRENSLSGNPVDKALGESGPGEPALSEVEGGILAYRRASESVSKLTL